MMKRGQCVTIWVTYALAGGSTGTSSTGLTTGPSLAFLTSRAGGSLDSSGALGNRETRWRSEKLRVARHCAEMWIRHI